VGAGDCRHFDVLRRYCDLECAGVEIQPAIAARGRARGYAIEDGMLETMPLDGHESRYDIVSMNHVLEHVIHPGLVLERALRLLRPGGWLVGQLPGQYLAAPDYTAETRAVDLSIHEFTVHLGSGVYF
jgi:SAM-dependent methyltransferase